MTFTVFWVGIAFIFIFLFFFFYKKSILRALKQHWLDIPDIGVCDMYSYLIVF